MVNNNMFQPNQQPIAGEDPSLLEQPMASNQPDQEGMKADIQRRLDELDNKNKAVDTERFIAKNKLKAFKTKLLNDIYSSLKDLGVDPNSLESINSFLQKLEQQDPDLLTLFESAINALDPDAATGLDVLPQSGEPTPGGLPGLMGKYNNLQTSMLGQQEPEQGVGVEPPVSPGEETLGPIA